MPHYLLNGSHSCVLPMSVTVRKRADWKIQNQLLFHSHKKQVFIALYASSWWGTAKTKEWSNSPRRHVAETRLVSVHPRPIKTIQSVSTQACDSVCRLWLDNEGFPGSAVGRSHSPQPLHPDWGEANFTQPERHKENSLYNYFKGRFFYSGQRRPVMVENVFRFLIIPFHGGNHLAMPMLCGWKHVHPSWGWHRRTMENVHVISSFLYTKRRKSVPGPGLEWR